MKKKSLITIASLHVVAIIAVGCGASSFHSKANPNAAVPGVVKPTAKVEAYRFSINQKEVSEEAFNAALEQSVVAANANLEFKSISIAEYKLNDDRGWVFKGESAELMLKGDVCREKKTVLQLEKSQNDPARIMAATAGWIIPFRVGPKRAFLELPAQYETTTSVSARGVPKIQAVETTQPLTVQLAATQKDLALDLKTDSGKVILTVLKPSTEGQYISVQAEYAPSECPTL